MDFYPADVPVPEERRTARLWLRPLRETDVTLDYDAVMASAEQLRRWSQTSWPTDDFTLAENREDLQRHEREHLERVAFTYTVMNPAGSQCLGCVYIQPVPGNAAEVCAGAGYAANVGFWVRTAEIANDLDQHLLATIRDWFRAEWPFECVVFIVSQQEARQAEILRQAGLEQRLSLTMRGDRPGWLFG